MSLLRSGPARSAFIEPCLPSPAPQPPAGGGWLHEIKLDGYRLMVRRDGAGERLLTRRGNDWTPRYPLIRAAAHALRAKSFLIDGEVVCCDEAGMPDFELLRRKRNDPSAVLVAFDLIELNGRDLRREPIEARKAALYKLLGGAPLGIQFNDHMEAEAATVFQHACAMGLEGIVSKRKGSSYQSGRSPHWLKIKNPNAPAVKREAEEEGN
jgi:ATP-dependent DNA ligase